MAAAISPRPTGPNQWDSSIELMRPSALIPPLTIRVLNISALSMVCRGRATPVRGVGKTNGNGPGKGTSRTRNRVRLFAINIGAVIALVVIALVIVVIVRARVDVVQHHPENLGADVEQRLS